MPKHYNYKYKPGRPTKYRPYFCKLLIDYFDIPATKDVVDEVIDKKTGKLTFIHHEVPNSFPTLAGFSAKYNIDDDTFVEWSKIHPEFSVAYKKAKKLQENILVHNAMTNKYAQPFAIFFAKNNLGYSDKSETDITSKGKSINIGVVSYKK